MQHKRFWLQLKKAFQKSSWFDWLVFLIITLFSIWLMFSTFAYKDGQLMIKTKLWSDFAAHLPLIRSFSFGKNFPPQYPQFANEPIRYHYLFYLLVGLLEKIGLNLALALNGLSALGFSLLLLMIYRYAKLLTGGQKKQQFLAGGLAIFLFLFNGSLTFVDYFKQTGLSRASLSNITTLRDFVNFGPWTGDTISAFWNWNIYTNQRHLAISFGLVLWLLWPLMKTSFAGKKAFQWSACKLVFFWLGLILLPFLNQAAYVIAFSFMLGWLVLNHRQIKQQGLAYGFGLLCSLPGFIYFWLLNSSAVHFRLGFLATDRSWLSIVEYWWQNLGLYLILWPILYLVSNKKQKKLWLVFSSYFVLANVWQLSTDLINNHKLINFFQIGLVILLAVQLAKVWSRSFFKKVAVLVLIIPLTLSGLIDVWPVMNDRLIKVEDSIYQPFGSWLSTYTEPNDVFLTSQYLYNPVSLMGRKTYLDYGYFAWSLGYDDQVRRENLIQIFQTEVSIKQWCDFMFDQAIDYVLISPGQPDFDLPNWENSWLIKQNHPTSVSPNGDKLYSVSKICSVIN
jgi:hypothetical protein